MSASRVFMKKTWMMASVAIGFAGCGGGDLSDAPFGGVDLSPFLDGGAPTSMASQRGYIDGTEVRYYDFGVVANVSAKPDEESVQVFGVAAGSNIPRFAPTNPIYFLFDQSGNSLSSAPEFDQKTGRYFTRGGTQVRKLNPVSGKDTVFAYTLRQREALTDSKRKSSDFQRPIVNVLPSDRGNYSGLWEIVEVKVPNSYKPDSIKSLESLQLGIDSGEFTAKATGAVINCPLVDDRTLIAPTLFGADVIRPRMEVWYRKKLASCFLADGIQTLIGDDGKLLMAGAKRLTTFDITSYALGEGTARKEKLVSPIGRLFIPKVTVPGQNTTPVDIRFAKVNVSEYWPKRTPSDPPGYRPIRWAWDIEVPTAAAFDADKVDQLPKSVTDLDRSSIKPRGSITFNYPTIGKPVACKDDDICKPLGLRCDGKACAEAVVGFGEFCSPQVAQCAGKARDDGEKAFAKDVLGLMDHPGYTCFPAAAGHCQIKCDATKPNTLAGKNVTLEIKEKSFDLPLDSRCGGEKMPGFNCVTGGPTAFCARVCDRTTPTVLTDKLCGIPTKARVSDTRGEDFDVSANTYCLAPTLTAGTQQFNSCLRNPVFAPVAGEKNPGDPL